MARPLKEGLCYFPLDVSLFDNRKIKRLLREYGSEGFASYIVVLCDVYRRYGYYTPYDDDFCFDVAVILGLHENQVREIIQACCEIGLFDEETFQRYQILTSVGIQERYQEVCKRSRNQIREDILLIPKTGNFVTKTEVFVNKTPVYATKITQKEKDKEKENEIQNEKEKEDLSLSLVPFDAESFLNEVMEYFNTTFQGKLPSIAKLTFPRANAVLSRQKEFGANGIWKMFENVKQSPFLYGENNKEWKADFDWLFKAENFIKVLEGKYNQTTLTESSNGKNDTTASRKGATAKRSAELQHIFDEAIQTELD